MLWEKRRRQIVVAGWISTGGKTRKPAGQFAVDCASANTRGSADIPNGNNTVIGSRTNNDRLAPRNLARLLGLRLLVGLLWVSERSLNFSQTTYRLAAAVSAIARTRQRHCPCQRILMSAMIKHDPARSLWGEIPFSYEGNARKITTAFQNGNEIHSPDKR